jgi:uncharacterized coiled-coil protein SlyX
LKKFLETGHRFQTDYEEPLIFEDASSLEIDKIQVELEDRKATKARIDRFYKESRRDSNQIQRLERKIENQSKLISKLQSLLVEKSKRMKEKELKISSLHSRLKRTGRFSKKS